MYTVEIRKGFYFGAGSVYKWKNDYHIYGVGIDMNLLLNNDNLFVKVNGKKYSLDCTKALQFINKYKSVKEMKHGIKIGIISKSLLELVVGI